MLKALLILFTFIGSGSGIEGKLDSFLRDYFSDFISYEYEILTMPGNGKEIEIDNTSLPKLTEDKLYIPVNIVKENSSKVRSHIVLKVSLFKYALLANKAIERNNDLNDSLFHLGLVDVTNLKGELVNPNSLSSLRNKMFIEAGAPLLDIYVEEKPIIAAGEMVFLNSTNGSVNIQMQAVSRQEGREGEIIRVKTQDNKLFKAKVLDSKNVLVVE